MPRPSPPAVSATERRQFERARDAATLQLLFKASRLANERALDRVAADPTGLGARVRPAHTALFAHLDFEGVRLTELASRVGVTKQAVGQLVDDLAGLGILREVEATLRATVGARRMRDLHETLRLVIAALERSG